MNHETLQIKVVAKIVPQNLPTDIVGTSNPIIEERIVTFDIVTDLTSDDITLTRRSHKSIREIDNHSFMSESTKVSAISAIRLAKTANQLGEIIAVQDRTYTYEYHGRTSCASNNGAFEK